MQQARQHETRPDHGLNGRGPIRFPPLAPGHEPKPGHLSRLRDLLPRRWRRRVVIHGRRYWLPG